MKTLRLPLIDILRPWLGGIIGVILVVAILGFKLDSIGPGVAPAEVTTVQVVQGQSLGLRQILLEDPLFLPHQLGIYTLEKLELTNLMAIRSVSALFGALAVISFYLILKHWHTRRIAILGSALLLTSSGLLHAARLAAPESAYLLLVPLLYLGIKLQQGRRPFIVLSLILGASLLLLYLPGMVWLLLPAILWQRQRIISQIRDSNSLAVAAVLFISLVALAPLVYALVTQNGFWQQWLGYQRPFVSVLETAKTFAYVPVTVFFRGPGNPMQDVGRLPLLDIATSAFVVLGCYWYFFQRGLDRVKFLILGLMFGALLMTAYGEMARVILLPFLYILATAGITLMLQQWFTVFPRNPLARTIGVSLISILVLAIGYYHLQRYFVAWPNAADTRTIFTNQP